MAQNTHQIAVRVSNVGIFTNIGLSLFKFIAGFAGHSSAMISDAIHSASDVFASCIALVGVSMGEKNSDKEHPYGHEKLECVAGILLSGTLFATGIGVGYAGIRTVVRGTWDQLPIPGVLPLIAAVVSIGTKEWMFWYTRSGAKRINSPALMASAWHHRSDALSSIGSLAGVVGARLGYPVADPIASLVICGFIIKVSVDIFRDAVSKLDDHSMDPQSLGEVKHLIEQQKGVVHLDNLKTRLAGNKAYVDVEIAVNPTLTVIEGHNIAENVHHAIENAFPQVKHCMVHVNPALYELNVQESKESC
ncbi:MAG: cation diffusion facilitator family transporter [Sphaerochaeta sp.]|jgi:cation diffusion facilitator family transporter|nr:cation diffusion facilitator family transporter [Sphaerochaeta sp.]MCH3919785.1 cation diffusion facilitator family transporter [Sphaerochaeta sp.]MCI2045423.1 cation diffusion facilitator family transporter [Sphaerochaeta sp.]MCI2077123.1 cation diffusion facilitator family transporter [Sphaerochaeta sp.]MCI2096652.1 cation diffusion facilitator family transporter [Sphaerochaeta sp.]